MTNEVSFEVLDQYGGVASAVAVAGDTAFVGFGPRLASFDISDPANPQMLGITDPLSDNIREYSCGKQWYRLPGCRASRSGDGRRKRSIGHGD